MKILIITYEFPPLIGGAATYAREIAVGMVSNGCSVEILTCYHGSKSDDDRMDIEFNRQFGVQVTRFKPYGKLFFLQLYILIHLRYNNKLLTYDHILLADARAIRFAIMFFKSNILKICTTVFHGGQAETFIKNANWRVKMFGIKRKFAGFLMKTNTNIAVSYGLKNQLVHLIPELERFIKVVHHGIDINLFYQISYDKKIRIRKNYGINEEDFVIISTSRLEREKGQDKIIKALEILNQTHKNLKLILVGDGSDFDRLRELSAALDLNSLIIFTGRLTRQELADILAASDLAVMLSRAPYESFGIVNIEANACGLPVIGTNHTGVNESIDNGITGVLVDSDNEKELIEKVELFFDKSFYKKIQENALNKVKRDFTNTSMALKTLNFMVKE